MSEDELSFIDLVANATSIVIYAIIVSILLVILGLLDYAGLLNKMMPVILGVYIGMIAFLVLIILIKYIPDIITGE